MALTTAQQVRLRIQDIPQLFDLTHYGDGSASAFAVGAGVAIYRNLTSATAYVPSPDGWSATAATFNASGYVTFSGAISAQTAFRVRGVHSVFSDDEIGHFTAVGGNVAGAALEAARALQFDAIKRASWAAPDGSEYDDTAAIQAIKDIIDDLLRERDEGYIADGGFASWSVNQQGWS